MSTLRHIAIVGTSFCGSTVTSYVLGSLPGVATIGESHWLTDTPNSGERIYCAHCGAGCALWTDAFRQELVDDRRDWYVKIAQRLETSVLVSSDKTPDILERLDPGRDYDLVVLFKPPALSAGSHLRQMRLSGITIRMEWYLGFWREFYSRYLDGFATKGAKVFVNAESLYAAPESGFRALSSALRLPFEPSALEYWRKPHHAMGGNFNPYSRLESAPETLPVAPLTAHPLDADQAAAVRAHQESREVFDRLRRLSDEALALG